MKATNLFLALGFFAARRIDLIMVFWPCSLKGTINVNASELRQLKETRGLTLAYHSRKILRLGVCLCSSIHSSDAPCHCWILKVSSVGYGGSALLPQLLIVPSQSYIYCTARTSFAIYFDHVLDSPPQTPATWKHFPAFITDNDIPFWVSYRVESIPQEITRSLTTSRFAVASIDNVLVTVSVAPMIPVSTSWRYLNSDVEPSWSQK